MACTAVVEHLVAGMAGMALRTPAWAARHTGIAAAEAPAHIPPAWHSRPHTRQCVNASMHVGIDVAREVCTRFHSTHTCES